MSDKLKIKGDDDAKGILYFPLSRLSNNESIFENSEKNTFSGKYENIFTPIIGKQLAVNTYYDNELIASANTPITIELLRVFDDLKINFKVNNQYVTDAERNIALDAALDQIIKSKKQFFESIKKEDIPIIQKDVRTFIASALNQNTISSFQIHYEQIKGYLEFANSVITSDEKYIGTAAALRKLIENEQNTFKLKREEVGETIQHSIKTAWITLIMAVELDDFNEKDYERLSIICMAHDCGKALIPEEILYKNGRLNQLESDIIKSHVLLSYILTSNNQTNLAFEPFIIAMHHIKEDKNIPQSYSIAKDTHTSFYEYLTPEAQYRMNEIYDKTVKYYRLMNLTDTFEAITAERVYKKPSSLGKTIDIMLNENKKGEFFYQPYLDKLIKFVIKNFLPKNMIFKISDEILEYHYTKDKLLLNEKKMYQTTHRGVIVNPSANLDEPLECIIFNYKTKKRERDLFLLPSLLLDYKYL